MFKSLDGGWLVALCAAAKACTCELPQASRGDCGGSMWDLVPLSKGLWEFLRAGWSALSWKKRWVPLLEVLVFVDSSLLLFLYTMASLFVFLLS